MTGINLSKGANTTLLSSDEVAGARFHVVLQWTDPSAECDVDVSVLLLGSDGKVRADDDFIFYNAPSGADGAVRLLGKTESDVGSEDKVFIDLEALPDDVHQIAVAASVNAASGFGSLRDLSLAMVDSGGQGVLRYEITDASTETAFVFGEIYRRNDSWKFRAVGQGWDTGLAGLATDYGIQVADDEPTDEVAPEAPDDGVEFAVEGDTANDLEHEHLGDSVEEATATEFAPSSDESPTMPSVAMVKVLDSSVPTGIVTSAGDKTGTDAAGAIRLPTPRTGVSTQRKKPRPPSGPPKTQLGNDGWQASRLFSVYGVGGADEQEKRATSALLSTMMGVKEFGKALISRFGGPNGLLETFLEAPFKLQDRTLYPDGVIKAARAGRTWTALLETKTGTNALRLDQVEDYLEIARLRGFDAVITLSNDIAPVGGDHPVGVDKKKLKKVALHHISWSEVLHEAQMQLTHRGVEDRTQAWILHELIRYLEHPRSGAATFDDMGASWVPVREAISAGTLRPANAGTRAVASSWDKLTRQLCLQMSSQLGVQVQPVVPRAGAKDHESRLQGTIANLVAEGTLKSSVRVPNSIGTLSIVADVRTNQIRIGTEFAAPRDGGASRRINWLLRQLREAPDKLSVEVVFARRDQTSCELLKDLRESNVALIPDATADVRGFRLSQTFPMGTKRNGVKGAFVPSVMAAVDSFYAQVVQTIKPIPAAVPRLPQEAADEAAETLDDLNQLADEASD